MRSIFTDRVFRCGRRRNRKTPHAEYTYRAATHHNGDYFSSIQTWTAPQSTLLVPEFHRVGTGSAAAVVADFTASRELHPALKNTRYLVTKQVYNAAADL